MFLRRHQQEAVELAQAIVNGQTSQKTVVAAVTPGGGKTLMASLFAHELIRGGVVKQVVIVVPRDSLRLQVREGFTDVRRGLTLRVSADGNKGLSQSNLWDRTGYVTTYQAIATAPKKHLKKILALETLLILDEPHHLSDADKKSWKPAVQPLVDAAKKVLLCSGTLWRHDRKSIPFVPYDADKRPIVDIRYTRRDALDEKSVVRMCVKLSDGDAEYWHLHRKHSLSVSEANSEEASKALKTLLVSREYREAMLSQALGEWMQYRETVYRSRAIIICDSQASARDVAGFVRNHYRIDVCLAISDEKDSRRRLQHFREHREGEVLVTVGMAYEGLDVPDCTHLVCLTDIRSKPWLEQAFARVTRYNQKCGVPWTEQYAFIFAPMDPKMVRYIDEALSEQDERYQDTREATGIGVVPRKSTFSPESGEMNGRELHGNDNGIVRDLHPDVLARANSLKKEFPILSAAPFDQLVALAKRMMSGGGDGNSSPVPA